MDRAAEQGHLVECCIVVEHLARLNATLNAQDNGHANGTNGTNGTNGKANGTNGTSGSAAYKKVMGLHWVV